MMRKIHDHPRFVDPVWEKQQVFPGFSTSNFDHRPERRLSNILRPVPGAANAAAGGAAATPGPVDVALVLVRMAGDLITLW